MALVKDFNNTLIVKLLIIMLIIKIIKISIINFKNFLQVIMIIKEEFNKNQKILHINKFN